jgi:uncharacterized protein (DUF433 family)
MDYVEKRDNTFRITGTRISLDSMIYAFRNGQTAEGIAQSFPLLTLEQIYGAIAFYLGRRSEIDAYLEQEEADYEAFRHKTRETDPVFYQKLADARHEEVRRS